MITRLHADNVGPLVGFEWLPKRLNLLLGENGSGKSSALNVLSVIKSMVAYGQDIHYHDTVTRWTGRTDQVFGLDVELEGVSYSYSVTTDQVWLPGRHTRREIKEESLLVDGVPIYHVSDGRFRISNRGGVTSEGSVTHPTLSSVYSAPRDEAGHVTRFRSWLRSGLNHFDPDPRFMPDYVHDDSGDLYKNLSNFSAWYVRWADGDPVGAARVREALSEIIPTFGGMRFRSYLSTLVVDFGGRDGIPPHALEFAKLSVGQKQLCALYVLLHAFAHPGRTLIIEDPTHNISSREVQPWLNLIIDAADVPGGPQVILASHDPEIIDQLAPQHGTLFMRDGGATRITPFKGAPALTASETVSHGWFET